MFTEEKTSWEQEMLIREAIENAEQGFTVHLRNGARITVSSNSPSIDIIIYGLEKAIREGRCDLTGFRGHLIGHKPKSVFTESGVLENFHRYVGRGYGPSAFIICE